MKQKLLLLGGSQQQIVAIETAKKMGLFTILCDYLPDNPGQHIADKFYLVSTTDKEAVLEVATKENIDGIIAYASDPAAPTAAYVAEKLGLPGNPFRSVEILCNKDRFRDFLKNNGFNTPNAKSYANIDDAISDLRNNVFKFPVMAKPVDSSGSKGVGLLEFCDESKLLDAFKFSKFHKIIIEEYVEKYGYQVAGDGLSINGKLVFSCFANDHFDSKCENPFVPISASFPYNMPKFVHEKIKDEIQKLLTSLKMKTSTYNFDIRIDNKYNVYLMEVAPRDGGNYIPDVIKYFTGIDLVKYSILAAMGHSFDFPSYNKNGFYSYYAVHSFENGILDKINISDEAKAHIVENHISVKPGDYVSKFVGSNSTLGCLIMKFDSEEQMLDMMDYSEKWINVSVKNNDIQGKR